MMPIASPPLATRTGVRPRALARSSRSWTAGVQRLTLLEQTMIAEHHLRAAHLALRAAPVERPDVVARRDVDVRRTPRSRRSRARSDDANDVRPTRPARRWWPATRADSDVTSTTSGVPRVSVPVLSNATHRTRPARSRCTPPLISTPLRAAPASAATTDTGVEMTSAHGHDTTSSTSAR